jgi:hypothetical protein
MAEPATAGTSGSIPTPTTAKSHPTRGNLRSGEQPDAVGAVNPADQGAELLAEDPLQRVPAGKDRGDLHPELGQGGRHLAADESHAHHHRTPARHDLVLDRVALGHRPQVVDSGQLGPGNLQPPVPSSRRDQELPVLQVPARAEGQLVRRGVDRDRGVGAELHVVGLVPADRLDVPVVEPLFGSQVGFGERGTAERDLRFPADEHDRPAKPLVTQGCRSGAPGLAATYDHHRLRAGSLEHALLHPPGLGREDGACGTLLEPQDPAAEAPAARAMWQQGANFDASGVNFSETAVG